MVKRLHIILTAIVVICLMTLDFSFLYTKETAFLFKDDPQALFHFCVFFGIGLFFNKYIKFVLVAAILAELIQFGVSHRSFQMIDLLCNVVAVLAAEKFITR